MPSLVLAQSALAAPNAGPHTLAAATLAGKPLLVAAVGARVDLLDENCKLVQGLPLEHAFPGQAGDAKVDAVALDPSSGQIAAVSNQRVAVWAQRGSTWRVHSSFRVPHAVTTLDFVQGKIAAAGDGLSLWELDETGGFAAWKRIGSISLPQPVAMTRLSPSATVLASVTTGSSTVLIHSILPKSGASSSSGSENRVHFRSRAAHSVRIRNISWRPSDDVADSGPVLFTLTVDGTFRIWGCMLDEPSFFSLWAALNVHSALPKHVPLATLYWRTKPMTGRKEGTGGTEDQFVTVFADGSVELTTVSNFDSRPPTCLVQSTELIQEAVFTSPSHLSTFRHPFLLPSRSQSASSFHLIGRCSRSTLLHARATLPLSDSGLAAHKPVFHAPPVAPPVSLVGEVRRLVPALCGRAVVAVGGTRVQSWELGEEGGVEEQHVAELEGLESGVGVATWHNGRTLALAESDTLRILEFRHGRLRLLTSSPIKPEDVYGAPFFSSPLAFFAARAYEEALTTTLVYVSRTKEIHTFVYHSPSRSLTRCSAPPADIASPLPAGAEIAVVERIPPAQSEEVDDVALVVVDSEGTLYRWQMRMSEPDDGWTLVEDGAGSKGIKTSLSGIEKVAMAADGTSAIVSRNQDGADVLSIWDPKASEFSSGKQFEREFRDGVTALSWSLDGRTLAIATETQVDLLCAQRLDDLSGKPSWITYGTVSVADVLPKPLSCLAWTSSGLTLAAGDHVFFYSPRLDSGRLASEVAAAKVAPLPLHHPQLLFQAVLQGHFDTVAEILANLAAELTDDGHLTPLPTVDASGKPKKEKLTLDAFLKVPGAFEKKMKQAQRQKDDLFAALTTSSSRTRDTSRAAFSEDDLSRLLGAIRKRSMRGLSGIEHEHLAVLAQTVLETQARKSSLDENGLRFLVSLRSFYIYHPPSTPPALDATPATLNGPRQRQRLKYRDMVWAFHSESQDLLLEEGTKACGGKLTWTRAKTLGVGMWLKSHEALTRTMETIGRTEFQRPDEDDRDPITATLFYLALKKKHIVQTFWKQSSGHAEQRQMIKFLSNDFDEQRWKSAALKNAYALMSKQRFLFAAAFFLLGGSLKDAVAVILRQLDDFQLAIAIARTYEGGDDGPVLRSILEDTVIPLAFKQGSRWLGSWALWMLNRRDLAVQIIITPLAELASRLPYKLDGVSSPAREDPALVLLLAQLRSWSLQTVKGAIAIPGRTEFNFVLHISRILCRMGCHVLALNLLRTWRFVPPALPPSGPRRPDFLTNRRQSLLLSSTKLDLPLPSSALPSRVASPAPDEDAAEKERQRQQFREVVKQVKVDSAKAQPAEFSFDAFGF
ncbi:hypothetical protein JCM10207_003677 [Rhodosporidiobolus poonsookiae]